MAARYRRLLFRVEGDDPGPLVAALWESGTLGLEELDDGGRVLIVAYYEGAAASIARDWRRLGARLVADETLDGRDWMRGWRERALPVEIGRRLVVDPREPQPEVLAPPADRSLLRLPARTAFGTGSHASTRLAIELLEELELEGARVLDVGAGSGILAFAALLFGAAWVVGVEIDPAAALVAGQNRRLNDLYPGLVAGGVGALAPAAAFDLALVNVLPEHVDADLAAIRRLVRDGGAAIFSGIPQASAARTAARLRRVGFEPRRRLADEEWSALLLDARVAGQSDRPGQ